MYVWSLKCLSFAGFQLKPEADYIKSKNGLLFRIEAPLRTQTRYWKEAGGNLQIHQSISGHTSETNLDKYKFDNIIHNNNEINLDFLNNI